MKVWTRWLLTGIVVAALLSSTAVIADDDAPAGRITFTKDVLPILQQNCQVCHRPSGLNMGGMVAPMAFMTYEEVRPWAKSIATAVEAREMPPWHATHEFHGVFYNERTLAEKDIATLTRWVKTGAARGRPEDAPEPVVFPSGEWSFEPDLVITMPEPYFVTDDVEDLYVEFEVEITKEMLPEPRWIHMSEAKSGSSAVHHIIARPLGGLAPGGGHAIYPEGYGLLIEPGDTLTFDMHYHKEPGPGTGVWDQSSVAAKFHTEPVLHPVTTRPIGNNGFEIPPDHPNWEVGASLIFPKATTILRYAPHMHLRGKDMKYTAFYPDGTTEVLLDVPSFDFNWQTSYFYGEPKKLPAGTRIEVIAHFDNSAEKAEWANFNSERSIRFGGPTTDEMMLGWMSWADTEPTLPDAGIE